MRKKLHTNLGKGLKRARKEKSKKYGIRYSQNDFAEDMNVTIDTIRDWEQDYHLPKIPELLYMCDNIFRCDLDYLFMRSEVKKHDVEFIMQYTGLSEEAVEKLVEFKDNPNNSMIEALNALLISDNFENTLDYFQAYLEKAKECIPFEDKKMFNDYWRNISRDRDYLKYETSTNFNYTLDELGETDRETIELLKETYFSNPS